METVRVPKSEDFMLTTSPGEKTVYNWLSQLPEPWCFWHSKWFTKYVTWNPRKIISNKLITPDPDSEPMTTSECDFIVFHPNIGFVVLEVKGGRIRSEHGSLVQYTQRGKRIGPTDPISQARAAHNTLRNFYVNSARFRGGLAEFCIRTKGGYDFPGSHLFGVVFPDCDWKTNYTKKYVPKSGFRLSQIYDQSDISSRNFENYLFDLLKIHPRTISNKSIAEFFIEIVSSPIEAYQIKGLIIRKQLGYIEEMNRLQDSIIDLFENIHCAGFYGSAGTGKTYLAMKELIKYANMGQNIIFLCYNAELANFVREELNNVRFYEKELKKKSNIIITSILSFFKRIYKEEFKTDPPFSLFGGLNPKQREIFLELLKKKTKFDVIIIDEAQDIDKSYYELIRFLLKDSNHSRILIYYDDNQHVFSNDYQLEELGIAKENRYCLTMNIRNVDNIRKWIQKTTNLGTYKRGIDIDGHYPIIRPENKKELMDLNDAFEYISEEIWKLITVDLIHPEDIVVLSKYTLKYLNKNYNVKTIFQAKKANRPWIYAYKKQLSKNNTGSLWFAEPSNNKKDMEELIKTTRMKKEGIKRELVLYNTFYKFKGLESHIVFILWPGEIGKNQFESKELYNLASRAQFLLYLVKFNKK